MVTPVTEKVTGPSCLRLNIPLSGQRLFGFLLDSVEGLATHTRAADSAELEIWLTQGREAEFQSFLRAWERFQSGLNGAARHNKV